MAKMNASYFVRWHRQLNEIHENNRDRAKSVIHNMY